MSAQVRVRIEKKPKEFDLEHPHLTYYTIGIMRQDGKAASTVFTIDEPKWSKHCENNPDADREKLLMDMFSMKMEQLFNAKIKEQHVGRIILPQ